MLVSELSHRVKNMLAVVQSLAMRTLRQSESLDDFGDAFVGRLQALSGAHDMIFEGGRDHVELERIVERAMRPFESKGEIRIAGGPRFAFGPAASQTLILILHELATNAVKYGALSASTGRVSIGWRDEGESEGRRLLLRWTESGGPEVERPTREGQGLRFVRRSTSYELRGEARFEFAPDGLTATIDIPMSKALPNSDMPSADVREDADGGQ